MCFRMAVLMGMLLALTGLTNAAEETSLLAHSPTVSRTQVVFAYGGYLWSVPREGGDARQLTTGGHEGRPVFSPDGKWIAFTAQYDGNVDVFVMAAEGGEPRRLTWHPAPDVAVGWTPDEKRVLFYSSREVYADFDRLYNVPVEGGPADVLPMWRGENAWFSPDGTRLAYVPNLKWQTSWKRYKGGQDDADLHRTVERFGAGKSAARGFKRCSPGLVWRHHLFSIGPQRPGDSFRI